MKVSCQGCCDTVGSFGAAPAGNITETHTNPPQWLIDREFFAQAAYELVNRVFPIPNQDVYRRTVSPGNCTAPRLQAGPCRLRAAVKLPRAMPIRHVTLASQALHAGPKAAVFAAPT